MEEVQGELRRLNEQQVAAAAEVLRLQAENLDLDNRLKAVTAAPADEKAAAEAEAKKIAEAKAAAEAEAEAKK